MTSRTRRLLAPLLLCCLLGLAGCAALPFVDGGPDADPYAEPGEPLDGSTLVDQHRAALTGAGSATVNETRTVRFETGAVDRYRNVTALDFETGAALRHRSRPPAGNDALARRHVYVDAEGGAAVNETRDVGPDQYTHYFAVDSLAADEEIPPIDPGLDADLAARVDALNWTQEGVETHRPSGEPVTRYTATGEDARHLPDFAAAYDLESVSRLDGFEATLLVTEEGLVREFRFEVRRTIDLAGGPMAVAEERTVRVEDIDATEVEEPEWTRRT